MIKITSRFKPNSNAHRGKDPYYQSSEWKQLRAQVRLRDQGICQQHKRDGILKRAGKYAVVDHILSRKQGGKDELSNLELICKECHDRKSATEKER